MTDPKIKYYPVGNGDTSLITLSDNTKIIIDINCTNESEDEEVDERFNVRTDLLQELNRDNEIPYTDAFILTHPDNDHCRGFERIFYLGDPSKFDDDDLENELIRIDELWFTPRVFAEFHKDLSDDAKAFKKEADRRMKLFKENPTDAKKSGNRIRIIGYTDNPNRQGFDEVTTSPGNSINLINGSIKKDFSFFIHAPHKIDTDKNDDRNDTSLVLQARFDVDKVIHAGKALFGGDAGWRVWALILKKCKTENIEYDLFLAPHHCSWGFFNDTPQKDNPKPVSTSIDVLNKKRDGAIVISSSKEIKNNDDNPPHYEAKNEYVKIVGKENFLTTAEHPSTDNPLPIVYRITSNGPQKIDNNSKSSSKSGLIDSATSRPKTYG